MFTMETMNDIEGAEYSCQRDLTGEFFTRCSTEIQGTFNDDVHSSSAQHSRDKPQPHIKCEDGPMRTRVDESVRNDEFASYRFCCPPFCDPSPLLAQYASVPCPDHMLPRPSPFNFLNPLPGLGKNEPSAWTPKGPVPYGMSSAEVSDAVASIITEENPQQAYSIQESDGDEYRQCNYLEDQPRQKPPTSNVCQVVCSVNRGGQIVVLNRCSPNQMLHPVALGYGGPGSKHSWFPADPTLSPQHSLMQGRGEGLPVCQVQSGLSTQPYMTSLSCPAIVPPSSIHSPASGYTYNLTPAPYISQFDEAPCPVHHDTVDRRLEGQTSESSRTSWEKLKKPCNCTKSQCLKLYCDCFANGEVCSDCNCINCCNNMEHESERCRAIKNCLDRNPEAFHPKIDIRKRGYLKGRHTKGCNCKRSGCLKNYCECYEAKIMCSSTCKCVGCRNYEGSPVREPSGWDGASSTYSLYSTFHPHSCKCPLSCITPDVVEATCGCLLAQAEEAEKDSHARPQAEQMILEEFGQCLTQIVHSIFKSAKGQW